MQATASPRHTAAVARLRAALGGPVIAPEDTGFDAARAVYYTGFDRRPAAIAQPLDTADVSRVVSLARETGLPLAVRSGGHSVAGHSALDGGILLDLSRMQGLEIDPVARTAWAETGLTAGAYTTAVGAHGLATGFGDSGEVGIGGITLGGGIGFLVRKHGLTIDSLLAADVVTADGQVLRADAETHPDLFWAIRGGGGNFGVVTRLQFRLHPVDTIVGGMLMLPATPAVIRGFVAAAEAAPEALSTIANVMVAPPMPFIPQEQHGKLVMVALLAYAGPTEEGQRAVAPFRALAAPGAPIADMVRPMPYPEIYRLAEGAPHPVAAAIRSLFLDGIDAPAAETIVERLRASTAPMSVTQIRVLGGAAARVPADATAFAHRQRRIMLNVAAGYARREDGPTHEAWAASFAAALRERSGEDGNGVYVNFLGDEGPARVRDAYPGATWDRLAAIKARYDPSNLFRLNHNVPPAA